MEKVVSIGLLLVGAQVNLSALVPAAPGQAAPPWWVGGGLLWPFFNDTRTLLPAGGLRDTLTPIFGIVAAVCFVLAAAAVLGWHVPSAWAPWLIVTGAVFSIALQVIWFSGWAVLPLLVDVALLWAVFGWSAAVVSLRG